MSAPGEQHDVILAIECSNPSAAPTERGRPASVCIARSVRTGADVFTLIVATETVASSASGGRGGHDDDLVPAIERACRKGKISQRDLTIVAVSIGPGGYTSLRIAIAAAKMIAMATGARLIGVPTALVAARSSLDGRTPPSSILVTLASKNDTASLTLIRATSTPRSVSFSIVSSAVVTPDAVPEPLARLGEDESTPVVIADQFLPQTIAAAAERRGYRRIPLALNAADLAACATCDNLPFSDPRTLAPIYAREPDAVTLWRARHSQSPSIPPTPPSV